MAEIAVLHPERNADDIVTALRAIANDIEAGVHGLCTTAVVVIGHTNSRPAEDGELVSYHHEVFGAGPRHDPFTVRGLLFTAATHLGSSER